MKKAKIILSCVAILGVIGGALAFKASREPRNVFTLITNPLVGPTIKTISTTVGGIVYTTTVPNCTLTNLHAVPGTPVSVSSTTTAAGVVTAFSSAGHPNVITTYPYCTLWITGVTLANS